MFCTECGRPIKNGYKFCPYCGNRMDLDLMQEPQNEDAIPNDSKVQAADQEPAKSESEMEFFAENAESEETSVSEPMQEEPQPEQEPTSVCFPEDDGLLDPPPTFTFEEEPAVFPKETLQNSPYFVYSPEEDMHAVKAEPRSKPADSDYRPGHIKKSPAAVLAPMIHRGPSLGVKVLLILFIIAAALAVSVLGYQFLFTDEPFAEGWFLGM